jgi:hypothetical protein
LVFRSQRDAATLTRPFASGKGADAIRAAGGQASDIAPVAPPMRL